jgi:hypothetical protein
LQAGYPPSKIRISTNQNALHHGKTHEVPPVQHP